MQVKNILITIVVSILVSGTVLTGYIMYENANGSANKVATIYSSQVDSDLEELYEKVVNSVVYIENNSQLSTSSGSGFVYKVENGITYFLTNYHVVSNSSSLSITTNDGTVINEVQFLGGDKDYDIAVISAKTDYEFEALEFASLEDHSVGEVVMAIGSPLGSEYINSATVGTISGKDRFVYENDGWGLRLLQTDAAINPGNSGGPLFTLDGKVVGINSLKFNDAAVEGMGFTIPVDDVKNKLEYLENGQTVRPYIGIEMRQLADNIIVNAVVPNSPAAKAGIKTNDIIVKINDNDVKVLTDVTEGIYDNVPNDEVEVVVLRDNKEKTIKLKLGAYES